jgi:hypothetical protein
MVEITPEVTAELLPIVTVDGVGTEVSEIVTEGVCLPELTENANPEITELAEITRVVQPSVTPIALSSITPTATVGT